MPSISIDQVITIINKYPYCTLELSKELNIHVKNIEPITDALDKLTELPLADQQGI